MKLLINILILILLFSCSSKKDKAINKQKIETINKSSNNSIVEVNDSINTPTILPIIAKYDPKKYIDSVSANLMQVTKKHKEIPPDGTYIYDIAYAEWQGRSLGEKVKVIIKGNTIKIIAIGRSSVDVNNGETIDEGGLIKHNVTGDWLITDNPSDADLEAYGGCVGIATVIDFVNKKYWTC